MVLKIRLARFGKRNAPFYNIVVAQARTARNSKPLEVLGTSFLPSPQPHTSSYHTIYTLMLTYNLAIMDRHLRPHPQTPTFRRRQSDQGYQTRYLESEILDRCRRAAE